jgi:L-asparaginase / beta-aspartyl-peptidase
LPGIKKVNKFFFLSGIKVINMKNFSIAVHGGAGEDSQIIRDNKSAYEKGLSDAVLAGFTVLKKGGSAIDAVESAVNALENNLLFNAGRGSSLNIKGEVEMDAAIMNGENLKSGAVSMVKNVKNPVSLARIVMEKTSHVLMSSTGALELAKNSSIELEIDAYFITNHQVEEYLKHKDKEKIKDVLKKKLQATTGAVALDKSGNLAAATSSGGTVNTLSGRIGDSCIIGAGCYANNKTCAVSCTGDGEAIINNVLAHSVSMFMELTNCSLQQACDQLIFERNNSPECDLGLISVDPSGSVAISFNSERMHRAWMNSNEEVYVRIYK